MRFLRLLPLIVTVLLIWLLDTSHGVLPTLGRFLDPVNGAMTAAEPVNKNFTRQLNIRGLQQEVTIDLEDRLVPHITAKNDHDLYLAQGYIHAYFRLWQMDMQTRAAGGRISEVAGKKALKFDQGQRRKGMMYAAERSLKAMEADPRTKAMLDAYTEGINSYISSLSFKELPLEYKLMNFKPETWTSLRSALLLKYMADDLTGASDDIAFTLLRDQLGAEQFDFLFPERMPGNAPVIPRGTKFDPASLQQPAYPGDSVWAHFNPSTVSTLLQPVREPESGIGSNNWVVSGKHTLSGAPILCNDPHLGLNLPSLWFEIQLTAPGINTYGASLPGAPGVIIGFNENITWGFTNNYRDVKDYYEITADNRETYWFNGKQTAFQKRPEHIIVKDSADVIDTVLYTVHGPVQYEPRFPDPAKTNKMLAMCWMAHRGTNELLAVYLMNRATDYTRFTEAIRYFQCPAQNFAYADKAGNIAMWGQGQFINKWQGQGKFVMEGKDNLTLWGQDIPMSENPHVLNPEQGYVASANQQVTDRSYPYWYNGSFSEFRSWRINQMLDDRLHKTTAPVDIVTMKKMQQDVHSILAQTVTYRLVTSAAATPLTALQQSYIDSFKRWNYDLAAHSQTAALFQVCWYYLYQRIWQDEFGGMKEPRFPSAELTARLICSDTAKKCLLGPSFPEDERSSDHEDFKYMQVFFDDKKTPETETREAILAECFKKACDSIGKLNIRQWYAAKNTSLTHLAKIPAFSYTQLKTGGWGNTINAMKGNHGPSWRMVVEMGKTIEAYGIYPGGQSGNPGSVHYGDNVEKWVAGAYHPIRFVTATGPRTYFKYRMTLHP